MSAIEIIVKAEIRPALYRYRGNDSVFKGRCLVHMTKTGPNGGFVCECEDGRVLELQHNDFCFLDSAERFREIAWDKRGGDGE